MRKGFVFFLGMIIGAVLAVCILYFIGSRVSSSDSKNTIQYNDSGISLFNEPGDVLSMKGFRIVQVLSNGAALAYSTNKTNVQSKFEYNDPVVYFLSVEGTVYYDDLIINVPSGKVVRQIGTYRYETNAGFVKTVPIVQIFEQ